jgi:histidinol-phosphate/aromatic aminotransferase/cobyric acid decarboxylase-like protein
MSLFASFGESVDCLAAPVPARASVGGSGPRAGAGRRIDGIVKLASNENAIWGPRRKRWRRCGTPVPSMHLYPDGGAFYLRQAIAKKYGISATTW